MAVILALGLCGGLLLARLDAVTAAPPPAPDFGVSKPALARQLAQNSITVPLPPPITTESSAEKADTRSPGRPPLRSQPLTTSGASLGLAPPVETSEPESKIQILTTPYTEPKEQTQGLAKPATALPAPPDSTGTDSVIEVLEVPLEPGGDAAPSSLARELPLVDSAPSPDQAPDLEALRAMMRSLMDDNVVVATVDGEAIRWGEVFSSAQALPADYQARLETLFPALLERMIDLKLLAHAGRRQGLQHDATLKARMAAYEERLVREALLEHYVAARVTDESVRARYGTYLAKRKQDVEFKARHILVENEDAAREVIRRLTQGADFAELAHRTSIAPSAKRGGDLGAFKASRMVKGFAEAIRPLQAGQFTREPVQTDFGWHVILVESRSDALVPSFETVAADLREDLSRQVIRDLLSRLRADAEIEILPESELPQTGPQSSGLINTPTAGEP